MVFSVKKCAESSRHPFFYNLNKVEQGEAELVAVRNIKDNQFGTIYRTLLERDAMAVKTVKPSVHIVLSGDDGEKLTDEQAVELIDKCLRDNGIAEQPYVIFRHDDTDNVHYHIVSTKIKEDGKSILWNGIGKRLVHSLAKYQDEYGYVASRSLRNKKQEESQQPTGITSQLNAKVDALINDKSIYTAEMAKQAMKGYGVELVEFISKHTGKLMARLRRPGSRPVYVNSEITERLHNAIAKNLEKFAEQPVTFVIHNDLNASLYLYRPPKAEQNPKDAEIHMLHEAARSILKFRTWGAAIRVNETKEFVDNAVKGQLFGTVRYDMDKARFIGNKANGMLVNPDEVIHFIGHDGQESDLITPDFLESWRLQLELLKDYLERMKKAEIVKEYKYGYHYQIKKEQDGTMKLERLEWDRKSPVVNGKYSKTIWNNKAVFFSYKEIGHDAEGVYLKITDVDGKTRFINQNGIDLTTKKLQQLGVGGKGITP